ncbi:MAG: translational GTPase TypA [Candidatus Promineifilaceae bacterium]
MIERTDLRNIAIIAHVDHGKTTLVDGMLQQAKVFREHQQVQERVMDSNDLERERGITILAKNAAITINDENGNPVKINIVDTPGHADFGGEVERVLNMVDGVLLLVDAAEGPMPQTRFVLRKALEKGLRVIVVINKVDRRDARADEVLDMTFDLFIDLGASDEQADFPVIYAVGLEQRAGYDESLTPNLKPLFETILKEVPPPTVDVNAPLQMLVTTLDYNQYKGLTAVGRIFAGSMKSGQQIVRISVDGGHHNERVRYLAMVDGVTRTEVGEAMAGDIVAVTGLEAVNIGETLASTDDPIALPVILVDEPTVRMRFFVNVSPFAGREGKFVTSRQIRKRLYDELKSNVAMRVEPTDSADTFVVYGRGELHLAILIETMRREGYEFAVSGPQVVFKEDENGHKLEPFEEVHVECTQETVGIVIEMMGKRKGEMLNMEDGGGGQVNLTYVVPTRGLLGFRHQFLTATRGLGTMYTIFHGYQAMVRTEFETRARGSLVAWEMGTTTTFGLVNAEIRGSLFIGPGVDVYEGMVVGEHQRPGDMGINVSKKKHLDNMRSAIRDIDVKLTPPRQMSLDECIEYLAEDELLEVTPKNLRIRKQILNTSLRERAAKRKKAAIAG